MADGLPFRYMVQKIVLVADKLPLFLHFQIFYLLETTTWHVAV
jgi:hypothetical protein